MMNDSQMYTSCLSISRATFQSSICAATIWTAMSWSMISYSSLRVVLLSLMPCVAFFTQILNISTTQTSLCINKSETGVSYLTATQKRQDGPYSTNTIQVHALTFRPRANVPSQIS